jgi:hypothetical protein
MKTSLSSVARALTMVAAVAATALVFAPAAVARGAGGHGGGGWHGGAGGWHGGGHYHGYGGYRGYYWPGAFWGGVGIGIGIGAVGYYGGYSGGYYRAGYYAPYYDGYYYDAPLVVAPVYSTSEPAAPRVGQPVPQATAAAEPIFYPKNGQSAEATESDRRECNRWATTQRGAMNDASIFQRATFACMEGRGYTVR